MTTLPLLLTQSAGAALVALLYTYLHLDQRDRYLRDWAAAWAMLTLAIAGETARTFDPEATGLTVATLAAGTVGFQLMLRGSERFFGGRPHRLWPVAGAAALLASAVLAAAGQPADVLRIPATVCNGLTMIASGMVFLRHRPLRPAHVLAGAMALGWGLRVALVTQLPAANEAQSWAWLVMLVFAIGDTLGNLLSHADRVSRGHVSTERTLRDLAVSAADWIWQTDRDHRLVASGAGHGGGLDPPLDRVLGQPFWDVVAAGEDGGRRDACRAILERRRAFHDLAFRLRDADGVLRHLRAVAAPLTDADGRFAGYQGLAIDMSAAVEAERQAGTAHRRLAGALDVLPVAIALLDSERRLLSCNARMAELLPAMAPLMQPGTPLADILAASRAAGLLPDDDGELAGRLAAGDARLEATLPDGRAMELLAQAGDGGDLILMLRDVTAARRHEAALAGQARLFETVVANTGEGIAAYDGGLRLLTLNRQSRRMLDLPDEAVAAMRTLADLVRLQATRGEYGAIDDVEALVARRTAAAGRFVANVYERTRPDGTVLEVRSNPIPGGGVVTTYRDVTEERRAAADLQHAKEQADIANRAKSEFLANISHELRTPLNAIIGFSEVMRDTMFGPLGHSRYTGYVEDIHTSGLHLLQLINDLLDLAKIEAGRMELAESLFDPAEELELALRLVQERADANGIALAMHVPLLGPTVHGDARAFRQILLNLLSNAVKFTRHGGRVDVTLDDSGDGLEVRVADTGIGMAEVDIPRALAPFGQVDGAFDRQHEGTGLGLPLARRLAELHGGGLAVASRLGEGTVVTVTLPAERVERAGDAA